MSLLSGPTEPNAERHEMSLLQEIDKLRTGASSEELRQQLRQLCKSDLYFLCKAILHYDKLTYRTHKPVCDFMQDLEEEKLLLLLPRGVYKTTIGTIGLSIFILIHDPNARILIVNQTATNAERMLLEIEQHLDGTNQLLMWLFPEMVRPSLSWTPWSAQQMTVPNREMISGTPSITATGVGAKMESQHFDWIFEDDIIGEKAMESELEMATAKMWHVYSDALFVEVITGKRRMLGTIWGSNDLYYDVRHKETGWKVFHRPARDWKTGELFFPEKLTDEKLNELAAKNYHMYLTQYQNDDTDPELLDFKPTWIQRYNLIVTDDEQLACQDGKDLYFVKDMVCGLFIDPAASGDIEDKAERRLKHGQDVRSNNAVEVWGIHGTGKMFLLDMYVGRGRGENPELQIAEKVYDLFTTWEGFFTTGYLEAYGAHVAFITIFNMVCKRHNRSFRLEPIRDDKAHRAKDVRIRSTVGAVAANYDLYIRNAHDQFYDEFCKFPQSPTKDTLDAAAYAVMVLGKRKPRSPTIRKISAEATERRRQLRMSSIGRGGY